MLVSERQRKVALAHAWNGRGQDGSKRKPGLPRENTVGLPITQDAVGKVVPEAEALPFSKRQIVDEAFSEAMLDIESAGSTIEKPVDYKIHL